MKKPYLLIITAILSLVLTDGMSLANDSNAETIEAGKQAAKKNSNDATSHFSSGVAYLKSGMYKEAIGTLKVAIKRDPDFAMSYYNLGHIYNLSKDKDSALKQYKTLENLDIQLANKLFRLIKR